MSRLYVTNDLQIHEAMFNPPPGYVIAEFPIQKAPFSVETVLHGMSEHLALQQQYRQEAERRAATFVAAMKTQVG